VKQTPRARAVKNRQPANASRDALHGPFYLIKQRVELEQRAKRDIAELRARLADSFYANSEPIEGEAGDLTPGALHTAALVDFDDLPRYRALLNMGLEEE